MSRLSDQLAAANRPELSDYQRELLSAIKGHNVTAPSLAAAMGRGEAAVRSNLKDLAARGLLTTWVVDRTRWYTLAHPPRRRK